VARTGAELRHDRSRLRSAPGRSQDTEAVGSLHSPEPSRVAFCVPVRCTVVMSADTVTLSPLPSGGVPEWGAAAADRVDAAPDRSAAAHAKPAQFPALDGLRGVLSVFIVLGHIMTYFVPSRRDSVAAAPLIAVVGLEYLSPVSFFILLSGFTLTLAYDKPDVVPFSTAGERRRFCCRRVARLAAVYYLSLALAVPFLYYVDLSVLIMSAIATPLMIQAQVVSGNSWNGPLWTVSALALCYGLFPWLLRGLTRRSVRALWALAGACYAVSLAVSQTWLFLSPAAAIVIHILGVLRVPQFAVGMCAALLSARAPPARPAVWVGVAAAVLAANTAACLAAVGATSPNWGLQQAWGFIVEWWILPAQAALALGLACPPGWGGPIQAALASRPAVALGAWSYAAYCLHFPLLLLGGFAVARGGPASLPLVWGYAWMPYPPWATPVLLVAVYALSAVAHYGFEVPMTRWLRRVADR
jgi:peptidoglycan/LPS O-acetylase OafA/YrhL